MNLRVQHRSEFLGAVTRRLKEEPVYWNYVSSTSEC